MKNYCERFANIFCIIYLTTYVTYSVAFKSYGASCLSGICDPTKFLVCNHFYDCECENPTTMIFDPVADSCVVKANETCYLEETWIPADKGNNERQFHLSSARIERKTLCVNGAICSSETKRCMCTSPLVADQNGDCQSPELIRKSDEFVMTCQETKGKHCTGNTGLRCVEGLCKCEVEFFQYFNGTNCVSRVHGPCQSTSDCTAFSACVTGEKYTNGRCQCLEGYVKNGQGRCDPGYDRPCDSANTPCTKERGLKCVDGKCKCADILQIYVESERNCMGLVGAHCTASENCDGKAICSWYSHSCECPRKYTEITNRTCIKSETNNFTDVGKPSQNLVPVTQVLVTGF